MSISIDDLVDKIIKEIQVDKIIKEIQVYTRIENPYISTLQVKRVLIDNLVPPEAKAELKATIEASWKDKNIPFSGSEAQERRLIRNFKYEF